MCGTSMISIEVIDVDFYMHTPMSSDEHSREQSDDEHEDAWMVDVVH